MKCLFKLVRLTDRYNNMKEIKYPFRGGLTVKLHLKGYDFPLILEHVPKEGENNLGILRTSKVEEIETKNKIHKITTQNSIYYFEELY